MKDADPNKKILGYMRTFKNTSFLEYSISSYLETVLI